MIAGSMLLAQHLAGAIPTDVDIQTPRPGDHALRILTPTLLELFLVNTKQPDPGHVDTWDWVNSQQVFTATNMPGLE